jgi:hypothetical protein
METATKYQFYSFQAIPQPNYDAAMAELAAKFQEALKTNLAKPYPYAPGYFGQKKQTGFRDMKKKTGNLYTSIRVSFDADADRMRVVRLDYWKNVNDGRKPGKYVPLKPLEKWIRNKGLNRDPKGRFKKFNIKGVAAAISKSIKEKGIQPTNFYDDSFDVLIEEFKKPDGPAAQLGIDLQTFLINILKEPNE